MQNGLLSRISTSVQEALVSETGACERAPEIDRERSSFFPQGTRGE